MRHETAKARAQAAAPGARRPGVLAAVLGFGGVAAALLPWLMAVEENVGLAALFAARGARAAPDGAVVVGISRDAARAVGRSTDLDTWSRDLHAQLVDALAAAGASAIVFDLYFGESRDAAGDEQFAKAIARAGNVLLLEWTQSDTQALGAGRSAIVERRLPPLGSLAAGALGGAPFVLPEVPVRVSRFWTFGRAVGDTPSLPVLALQAHLMSHYEELRALVERARPAATSKWPATRAAVAAAHDLEGTMRAIRGTFAADTRLAAAVRAELERTHPSEPSARALGALLDVYVGPPSRYLNFYGAARGVATIPYDRALAGQSELDVAGKVVFVGLSEPRQPEQDDDFYTVFSQSTGVNLSGVEMGATAFANLLERRALDAPSLPWWAALVAVFGVATGVLFGPLSIRSAVAAFATAGAAYGLAAYAAFARYDVWLPLVVPLLVQLPLGFGVVVWWSYRELAAQRERVRTALGYYVPAALARRLAEQAHAVDSDRELLHGTCLVTDAEQYTTVAEQLRPDDLAALMNEYYQALFRVVHEHGGEVSDTAGDAMIAVWASAVPDAGARLRAARAAVAVLAAVDEFNAARHAGRLPTRVGLASGELVLGNVGAEQRYEYRAIGDIVNTAARIQGLNRLLGTRVLVSAATLAGTEGLDSRCVGTFLLRGKRLPVEVYEPLAAGALDEPGLAAFAAALAALRAGAWHEAHDAFAAVAARYPGDGPSRYYAELAANYRTTPPRDWHGVVRVDVK